MVKIQERTAGQEIELLIKARYPIIYIVSHEERRVIKELNRIAEASRTKLYTWTMSKGLVDKEDKPVAPDTTNPEKALAHILTSKTGGLFAFLDFHSFLAPDRELSARFIRRLRDIADAFPATPDLKTLLLVSPILVVPAEAEKEIAVIDFPLPGPAELEALLKNIEASIRNRPELRINLAAPDREGLLNALLGLTLTEADNALAKSLMEDHVLNRDDIPRVLREKEQVLKKSGILEFIPTDQSMAQVGGLDALKGWFHERAQGFSEKARDFALPPPRGVLLIGVPGCGKSLCAKVIASEWQKPLLRFDVGRAFGVYIGESESNVRRAIKVAESLAPCILWIDEIEKEFGNTSGEGDSGTSARVFASFLTWMQEKKSPVFVLATANNVQRLPPEFLRKGRFDEIFFVDLPFEDERKDIFRIHLARRRRKPEGFDLDRLAQESEGYSGAEIEEAVIAALYRVFQQNRDVQTEDILTSLRDMRPLSEMMKEQIQAMRAYARDRTRYASSRGRTEAGAELSHLSRIQDPTQ